MDSKRAPYCGIMWLMKRLRRLSSIQHIHSRLFAEHHHHSSFQKALLKAVPVRLFGRAVASHIEKIAIEGTLVRIKIPDSLWRAELTKHKSLLLEKIREYHPGIKTLVITP